MMSILLRNKATEEIISFAKGSDSAMKIRLSDNGVHETNLFKDLNTFAARGLRTLAFGYKVI